MFYWASYLLLHPWGWALCSFYWNCPFPYTWQSAGRSCCSSCCWQFANATPSPYGVLYQAHAMSQFGHRLTRASSMRPWNGLNNDEGWRLAAAVCTGRTHTSSSSVFSWTPCGRLVTAASMCVRPLDTHVSYTWAQRDLHLPQSYVFASCWALTSMGLYPYIIIILAYLYHLYYYHYSINLLLNPAWKSHNQSVQLLQSLYKSSNPQKLTTKRETILIASSKLLNI